MKTIFFSLFTCILLALGLVFQSCEDDNNVPQIGVCLKNPTNDFRKALQTHAVNYLESYGLMYSIGSSENEQKQGELVASMVEKGCKVLIVSPEGEAKDALNAAVNAGIPVVFAEAAPIANYAVLVEIDNNAIGQSAATFFNKQENIKKIALFSVQQDVASSTGRIKGITDKLNANLDVVTIDLDSYTSEAGKTAAQKILAEHTDVDAIYAQDDEIALGVLSALAESQQIKAIVGCGGSRSYFERIKTSTNIHLATTLYSPKALMEAAVKEANEILGKGDIPTNKKVSLDSELVDKENVNTYLQNSPY
ncbi:substrate-binding domain-containing protein [Bacteroides sp. OttesenSCG-928-J23]|nr:substrate-binding domain-containing protein [Bacteroides sp. OttesenSCG-928-N06]MDL2247680.1 substrate-binding domain-containing protein [Bacteroides sp. OttesenSCG-928-J23]MDL2305427.1 substrate-binding domain-containing protein [Bacteroides sp. OttesenSCG-928-D19]